MPSLAGRVTESYRDVLESSHGALRRPHMLNVFYFFISNVTKSGEKMRKARFDLIDHSTYIKI